MTSSAMIFALVALEVAAASGQPAPPEMTSHVDWYVPAAPSWTVTTEWTCPGATGPASAKLAVNSSGEGSSRRFQVSLTELVVNGRPAEQDIHSAVANGVGRLSGLGSVHGGCRGSDPILMVQGALDGSLRTLPFDLTRVPGSGPSR